MTHQGNDDQGRPISALYLGRVHNLVVDAAATATDAFAASTQVVRVVSTVDARIVTGVAGTSPSAALTDSILPAGVVDYINVPIGGKLSIIKTGATAGVATVTEGA